MFLKSNFLSCLIFICFALIILPNNTFANEESEKHNAQGDEYYNVGKYKEAIDEYKLAIEIDNNHARYYNNLGWAYLNSKDYAPAEENFNKAIELSPSFANPYRGLACVYRGQSKNDEAKKYFLKAGSNYLDSKSLEAAIKDFSNAINLDSNDVMGYSLRSLAYCGLEKYDDALNDANKAIQLDKNFATAYRIRALIYLKQGRNDEAKTNYLWAGKKFLSEKEYSLARGSFNEAIEIDEKFGESYFYLGQVENYQSNYQDAINKYDKAISLGFAEDYVYTNRGYCKYKLNHYEEAIKDFNDAIKIDVTHASAYKWRGESYLNLNKYKDAETDFIKYLELEGENLDEKIKDEYLQKIKKCKDATGISSFEDVFNKLNELEIFGEVNLIFKVLLIAIVLDYATIIACGVKAGTLTAGIAAQEFFKEIIILLVIAVVNSFENIDTLKNWDVRDFAIAIILMYQLYYILENSERLGVPVPTWLKETLQTIREKIEGFFSRRS